MIFKQFYLGCLSQASYLVGDLSTGRAIAVDPRRDVAELLTAAADTRKAVGAPAAISRARSSASCCARPNGRRRGTSTSRPNFRSARVRLNFDPGQSTGHAIRPAAPPGGGAGASRGPADSGCDLLTISAHKLYAPKGVGALYARRGVRLMGQNVGGHQERERRAGTEGICQEVRARHHEAVAGLVTARAACFTTL